jgi:methionyl-tRNA formyltransferase
MRLVFAGTPEFSVSALDALQAAGHEIAGVFTQPDRPAGRGRRLTASAVAQRAATMGLPVFKPDRLGGEAQQQLRDLRPDAMVVVAYGLILPRAVLDIPVHGCLNIHASLLPRWRGAAPIQRAIEAGDTESGVTIMRMDAGLDTGPMLLRESLPITEETTGGELHDALAALGARLIVEALRRGQG